MNSKETNKLQEEAKGFLDGLSNDEFLEFTEKFLAKMHLKHIKMNKSNNLLSGTASVELGVLSYKYSFIIVRNEMFLNENIVLRLRKAMAQNVNKGLIIATGKFSRDAKRLSKQKGHIPVDLMDATELIKRLKDYDLLSLKKE